MAKQSRHIRWDKLDNTAILFPVIAEKSMTNVFRISVTLKEMVDRDLLQEALNIVLPKFDLFNVRLRTGVFWYYFEENGKPAPKVVEENNYPCRFIRANKNRSYLFRVSYYKKRINLEVFHVLTDGMGGINFLRELTYQYLRLAHPELAGAGDTLSIETSFNREDSFLTNYKKSQPSGFNKKKAFLVKGELMPKGQFGVIHGYMPIPQLKEVCRRYGVSINDYLIACYMWSVYQTCFHGMPSKLPIRVAVPVNLRPYFDSITTKNFFVMISAEFHPQKSSYTFEEVVQIVAESIKSQISKEQLENLFSYSVSNQKNVILRPVPLPLKKIAIKTVFVQSALANTITITNIGNIKLEEKYEPYVDMFTSFLPMSKGQAMKGNICSYKDTLSFSFSSIILDASIQRTFFKRIAADGVDVTVETNGEYYD